LVQFTRRQRNLLRDDRPQSATLEASAKGGNGRALLDDARALIQQYDR